MIVSIADALRQCAGPGSRDLHELRVRVDLVKHRKEALRFRQEPVVHVGLELKQSVVDPEVIILNTPLEKDQITLLPGEALEDLHELIGAGIERVIECRFVNLGVPFVTECFLAEIRYFFLYVQAGNRKIFQVSGQLENLLAHGGADFKRLGVGVLVQLA